MKRRGIFARGMALVLSVAMTAGIYIAPGVGAAAKAPKLTATKKTLSVGGSFTLKIKSNGTKIKSTKWKSSKTKVAGISAPKKTSVKVQAKSEGKSKITATVKFKAKKNSSKKLTCNVTVNKAGSSGVDDVTATATSAPTATAAAGQATEQPAAKPTEQPTVAPPTPTVTPTPQPYYYKYDYFAMYDAGKSSDGDNLYVNFVLSDSWETNTKLSAIEKLSFRLDTESAFDVDVYISHYDCYASDSDNASKIGTVKATGKKDEIFEIDLKGNSDIAKLDSENSKAAYNQKQDGMISFGFAPADPKGKFVLHDMIVDYHNNNTQAVSHHMASICAETSSVGSAKNQYNTDKKAYDDEKKAFDEEKKKAEENGEPFDKVFDKTFDKIFEDYIAELPNGLFEVKPKDSSELISNFSSMAELTEKKGYKFGTVVTYELLRDDPEFCNLVAHHCDSITAKNEFKAYSLLDAEATRREYDNEEDSMPVMDYTKADFIAQWAQDHNIKVRGHNLVWHNQMKEWFFKEGFKEDGKWSSNEVCRKRLEYYVDQVMRHFEKKFPGLVYCWDVVNEGCNDGKNGGIRNNLFQSHCSKDGENYIMFTFRCAYKTRDAMVREGMLKDASQLELVFNDYSVINDPDKRESVMNVIKMLNEDPKEKLCDAVGCEGYLGAYQKQGTGKGGGSECLTDYWVEETQKTIREFAELDPPVNLQITEMSMRNFDYDFKDEHGKFAAKLFEGLADINQETGGSFTSMSIWGFIDDPVMNKIEEEFDYWQYTPFCGMIDECYRAKPAFEKAHEILSR